MTLDSWIECKLADVCQSIDYGHTASANKNMVGPYFLRITDIVSGYIDWKNVPFVQVGEKTLSKYRLENGDIVIARTGASTGTSIYISTPPKAVFASYLVRLKIQEKFDSRFIAYYLKSDNFWKYIHGVLGDKSAQPNASATTLTNAPIRIPPLHEQRAIAHILGTLDDKIELNRRMNETLEAMAQAIFKSWFVDFDPVRAKAEGRDTGLPKEIADLFPDGFEESELGEIPRGWKVGVLSESVKLIRENVKPSDNPDYIFEYFSIPAFDNGQMPQVEHGEHIKSQKWRVLPGTILLSKLNPEIERVWLVDLINSDRAVCSTEFLVLYPTPLINISFLYCFLKSTDFRNAIESLITGTSKSHQRSQPNSILNIKNLRPQKEVLEIFENIVDPLINEVLVCRRQIKLLAQLRDAILPKLLSGEIRAAEFKEG